MAGKSVHASPRILTDEVLVGLVCDEVHMRRVSEDGGMRVNGRDCEKTSTRLEAAVHLIHQVDERVAKLAGGQQKLPWDMFEKVKCRNGVEIAILKRNLFKTEIHPPVGEADFFNVLVDVADVATKETGTLVRVTWREAAAEVKVSCCHGFGSEASGPGACQG